MFTNVQEGLVQDLIMSQHGGRVRLLSGQIHPGASGTRRRTYRAARFSLCYLFIVVYGNYRFVVQFQDISYKRLVEALVLNVYSGGIRHSIEVQLHQKPNGGACLYSVHRSRARLPASRLPASAPVLWRSRRLSPGGPVFYTTTQTQRTPTTVHSYRVL